MEKKGKTVLLTNDDGFDAKGIKLLFSILHKFYRVIIVAPDSEKSGVGHSFTYKEPLFYNKIENSYHDAIYSVSGSPADCVKFAVSYLLPTLPDMVISGLNIGENSGISSHYSGTVAAAREGAFWKIKSFAVSICEKADDHLLFYVNLIPEIINTLLLTVDYVSDNCFYNINFPSCKPELLKGIKATRQSMAVFDDKYSKISVRHEDRTREGFMIYGRKTRIEENDEFDSRALLNNWITVTPLSYDSTEYNDYLQLSKFENRLIIQGLKNG